MNNNNSDALSPHSMLYPTQHHHHPFFFQFSLSASLSSPSLPSQEMECVEAATALKGGLKPEVVLKTATHQGFVDDMWGQSGDDFIVDDLLDFSHGDIEEEFSNQDAEEEMGKDNSNPTTSFSIKDEFCAVPATELTVPADDVADLEWLSHFVDDSFSEFSAAYTTGNLTPKAENIAGTLAPVRPCFTTPVPAKARSKRTRTGGRVWSLGSPSLTESSSTTTSSSSSSSSSPANSWLIYKNNSVQYSYPHPYPHPYPFSHKPPLKKQKRKSAAESGGGGVQTQRRCSHCLVQKTPQWRAGPLGAKTLCNACGVRFKSGRLLPEYRPACSPTFSSEIHSNNHRKVMEMRRKKDTGRPEPEMSQAIQSF